jgi:DNA-binding NtrC family response regulator
VSTGNRPRILIVDDEASLLDVLRAAFQSRGWQVDTALDAESALAKFSPAVEIVLTDKNLPGPSGVELVARLRNADQAVGIVMMTGYGSVESARDTLNLGVDEYLEKPFPKLFAVVDAMDELRKKVIERRGKHPEPPSPMTILVAALGDRRERIKQLLNGADRLLSVETPEELKPRAKSEKADLVILDGRSFPEDTTCLVAEIKTRARHADCVVLSEQLTLSDVMRLIQLETKALIEEPLDEPGFADKLSSCVARIRRTRSAR